jgi:hypothetical protein
VETGSCQKGAMRDPIDNMSMQEAASGAAWLGWPTPIPMIQIKIPSFSSKTVNPSVKLCTWTKLLAAESAF